MASKVMSALMRGIRFLKNSKALTPFIAGLVALNLCIVASVAWFTLNRKTNAEEMGMGLSIDDTTAVYKAYMFDLETMEGTNLHPDGTELNVTNIDLNQYDTIFRTQNKYTPVVVQIQIVRNTSMSESGTVFITIERESTEALATGGLDMFSSSVVRFTALIDSDEDCIGITDPDTLYRHINTEERFDTVESYVGNDMANSKTFVTVEGEGADHTHGKVNSITVSASYTANDWFENEEHNMTMNVYLYLTYDVQLIECFMAEQTGGGISLDDNVYFFENDLKRISVSHAK